MGRMSLRWLGNTEAAEGCDIGNLALTVPLLERAGVAEIIDRHLQPDARCKESPGKVLSLLIAARLHRPTHRFEYGYDATVADRDAKCDGISAILTTLSRESSDADETFTK